MPGVEKFLIQQLIPYTIPQFLTQLRRLSLRSLATRHRLLFAGFNAMGLVWPVAFLCCDVEFFALWTGLPDRNEVVAVVEGRTVARVAHQTVLLLTHRRITPGQLAFFCSLIVLGGFTGDLTIGEIG